MRNILLAAALAALLFGCSTPQRPPSTLEQRLFTVETNVVTVTNLVTVTNEVGAVVTEPQVHREETYVFAPSDNARAIQETATAAGNLFGVGGVVGTAIGGLFALWAGYRSRQSGLVSANLVQAVETARSILLQLPGGEKYDRELVNWLIKHQAEAGVAQQVADLVAKLTDAAEADEAAKAIRELAHPKA